MKKKTKRRKQKCFTILPLKKRTNLTSWPINDSSKKEKTLSNILNTRKGLEKTHEPYCPQKHPFNGILKNKCSISLH